MTRVAMGQYFGHGANFCRPPRPLPTWPFKPFKSISCDLVRTGKRSVANCFCPKGPTIILLEVENGAMSRTIFALI